MYAIVEIAGQQFKVEKDQRYFVHQLQGKEGEKVVFDNVLLLDDKGKISVGAPAVKGAQVTAKIEKHLKGDKVIVFKKKRRKGYKVRNGHRQAITEIEISDILTGVTKKSPAKKKEAPKKAETKKVSAKKEKLDLSSLSVAQLKEMAKKKGLTGISSMKKADLVKALS